MKQVDLLTCPFCGAAAKLRQINDAFGSGDYRVECQLCGCQTRRSHQSYMVVDAWNRRLPPFAPLEDSLPDDGGGDQ